MRTMASSSMLDCYACISHGPRTGRSCAGQNWRANRLASTSICPLYKPRARAQKLSAAVCWLVLECYSHGHEHKPPVAGKAQVWHQCNLVLVSHAQGHQHGQALAATHSQWGKLAAKLTNLHTCSARIMSGRVRDTGTCSRSTISCLCVSECSCLYDGECRHLISTMQDQQHNAGSTN